MCCKQHLVYRASLPRLFLSDLVIDSALVFDRKIVRYNVAHTYTQRDILFRLHRGLEERSTRNSCALIGPIRRWSDLMRIWNVLRTDPSEKNDTRITERLYQTLVTQIRYYPSWDQDLFLYT